MAGSLGVEVIGNDVMDDVLERLAGTAPEFGPHGLSNHGPMAAEALVQLGLGDTALEWADRYRRRLDPAPPAGRPLGADEWDGALGSPERFGDFLALFRRELSGRDAGEVLAEWVPRLAPGCVGAAGHGVIRVAHGRRSIRAIDNELRREELAQGLAYWCASYLELPGPPALIGSGSAAAQVAELPHLPGGPDGEAATITEQLAGIDAVATSFEAVVAGLAPPPDPRIALHDLAAAGASAYVRNADRGMGHAIGLVHAVTIPMALELLLDDLPSADRATAFAYAWQAAAALHVCYGDDRGRVAEPDLAADIEAMTNDMPYPEELAAAALDSGDEHAIKLTEAALRAFTDNADPVLLVAAADAARRLR